MNNSTTSCIHLLVCTTLLLCMTNFAQAEVQADLKTYQQHVQPLLQQYCERCHGSKKAKAEIRLDTIEPDIINGDHFGKWEDIREAFNNGEMPPKKAAQPTPKQRALITAWLDSEFKKSKQSETQKPRGSVRRLTRYELRYALEDLLQFPVAEHVNELPEEAKSAKTGLKNSSGMLMISSPHLESYLNAIVSIIDNMKQVVAFVPHSETVDIANLDTDPPVVFASKGRKHKPPVNKVTRDGSVVVVSPGGYIDLGIEAISKYKFQTFVTAKADKASRFQVSIGFTRSDVDPRQVVLNLGDIDIQSSDEYQAYSLDSYPENLPTEMTRALDRPFFIRITNRGKQKISVKAYDYQGNVNTDLTASLAPTDIAHVDNHVRFSIASFISRAFRAKSTAEEIDRYFGIYQRYAKKESATCALLSTYKEILCSPRFFYMGIASDNAGKRAEDNKLAERLAFLLWCSVPDQTLLDVAATGQLQQRSVLATQVQRMLQDERSRRWVENFTDQWLQTSLLYNVAVDRKYYPKFKDPLKDLMRQETVESVNDVFRNGSSALNLLQADHVFVNQTLAGFYQLKGVRGDEFRKVPVDESLNRGGLLTQATFLAGNSDGMNSHAIMRGVWLADVILNDPPPDPPKNVPPLDESIPGFEKMTLNEKLFAHRNHAACSSCHQKIDPWGIPFENFDASGAWREQALVLSKAPAEPKEKGKKRKRPAMQKNYLPVERASTLPGGVSVDGIADLKEYLINHRGRDFAKGLTERILAYALSRDIDYHDEELVNHLVDVFETNEYSVPVLVREIVQSERFQAGH